MTSLSSTPAITESSILHSYLLTPSPLPTILPYSAFLQLVPATYRNKPAYASHLRYLYRDFQFQRDIVIDQVRQNIERECLTQAATWKAKLGRQIALEEGEIKAEDGNDNSRARKRRKVLRSRGNDASVDSNTSSDGQVKVEEDSAISSDDEFINSMNLAAQRSMYEHPANLHPSAHVLPMTAELAEQRMKLVSGTEFHTRQSLSLAMRDASDSLLDEVSGLESECRRLTEGIKDIVGSLSDLRYGKRQSGGDTTGEEYADVLESLEQFKDIVMASTKSKPSENTDLAA